MISVGTLWPASVNAALPLLLLGSVYIVASVYAYITLVRRISARPNVAADTSTRTFGLPEAVLATALALFLLLGVVGSIGNESIHIDDRVLAENLLFTAGIVALIAGFLRLRRFDVSALAGFSKTSFIRALASGVGLLLAAYPFIFVADRITQRLLGSGSSRQNIVELFNSSRTIDRRIMIIIFAVAIAPAAEEFLFRFFFYGILRRYFGRFFGLVTNALLFAAVHAHLPSFVPLFVLGSCFTIAYEWSGSILVSMTMHALFNAVSLTVLAFPELVSQ